MCGICGRLDISGGKATEGLIRDMCRSLAHRGPDEEGVYTADSIALGHRRLRIIDLSPAGHQPMSNEDDSIWLVFNGEIYDFEDFRKKLQAKGHRLRSRTDCEILIHLYEDEGIDCLKALNGMFAFALWDARHRRLWLGRDRLGIKPLHYYWNGRFLVFASEIKAILRDPQVPKALDWEALDLYLTLNYIPAPWTIFKDIRKLNPGHYLLAGSGGLSMASYWDIPAIPEPSLTSWNKVPDQMKARKDRLFTLLEEAVKRRLRSDVPLGAFLSGGIDSSIIAALMARHSTRPVRTFSIGYKDLPAFDETGYAREVARFNHTDHQEFVLDHRDILDAFPAVLENLDEPFADSSAVPTFIVSRETRRHVTVALSGDGGDELFAGYRMYLGEYWSEYYGKIPSFIRKGLIAPLINALPEARDRPVLETVRRLKKFIKGMSRSFPERFCGWREVFTFPMRQALLRTSSGEDFYLGHIRRMYETEKGRFVGDPVNLMLYMDVKGLLPGDMLAKVDRMSMANSLEVRVPFLDHTFAEYAFRLEGAAKLKGTGGKRILMETFKEFLPPSLHGRPKRGFEMPIGAWFRKELRFLIEEYLDEGLLKKQGLFHHAFIKDLIDRHMRGIQDTSWHIWNLIVFQHWYGRYF